MQIEITQLSKRYPNGVEALKGISLTVKPGVIGLLGPNGAGKSTLIHLLCGLIRPTGGEVHIDGRPLETVRSAFYARLGYLPQSFTPYPGLTAGEFLDYLAILKGIDQPIERQREVGRVLEIVHLQDAARRRTGGFSGGMKRRLGIAQALLGDPQILVLDEPTAGLDPEERLSFRNLLTTLSFERIVLISSHIISDLAATAERLVVLESGQLLFEGVPEGLRRQACGRIWEVSVPQAESGALEQKGRLITTRKEGDRVIARLAAAKVPWPSAQMVEPELEDAYILARSEVSA